MFNQYQMIPTPQTVNTNYYSLLSSEQDLNEIADDTTVVASNISTSSTRWPDDGHRTVRSNSRSSALAIREHQNDTAGFESLPLFPGTSSYVHSGTKIVKPKFESPTSVTPQSTVQEPQAPQKTVQVPRFVGTTNISQSPQSEMAISATRDTKKQKIRKLSEEQPSTFTVNIDRRCSLVDIIITLLSIANASVSNNQCQHLIPSLGANMRCICSHDDDTRAATSLSDACAVLSPRAKRAVENLHTEKMILDKPGLPWFDLSLFYAK